MYLFSCFCNVYKRIVISSDLFINRICWMGIFLDFFYFVDWPLLYKILKLLLYCGWSEKS